MTHWLNGVIRALDCCNQAALWMVQSVCLSVRPSHLFDSVPLIVLLWNFQGWLLSTKVMSMQKVKVRGQRWRSQRSKPNLAITPVWIHIWWRSDVQGLMRHRRCALLFFKVIRQISRSHRTKHSQFWPYLGISGLTPVWIHRWLWNDAQSLKYCRRGALMFFKVICQISRSNWTKNCWFSPEISFSGL